MMMIIELQSVITRKATIKLSTAVKNSYDELIFKNTYIHSGNK